MDRDYTFEQVSKALVDGVYRGTACSVTIGITTYTFNSSQKAPAQLVADIDDPDAKRKVAAAMSKALTLENLRRAIAEEFRR